MSGQSCAHAWPDAPRPVSADELLAERVLVGDQAARVLLIERIWKPLSESSGGNLLQTAAVYLESGSGLESTARILFVHQHRPVRLGKVADLTGYDLGDPHDAHTVRIALALGRLATPPHRVARQGPHENGL